MKDLLCNSWSSGNKTHPNKSALDKASPGSDIASLLRHWASFGVSLRPSGLWPHNCFRYLEGLGYSHDDPIFFLLYFPTTAAVGMSWKQHSLGEARGWQARFFWKSSRGVLWKKRATVIPKALVVALIIYNGKMNTRGSGNATYFGSWQFEVEIISRRDES